MNGTAALLTLAVKAGNTVQAGQTLASIDQTPYQQALDQATSALQEAQQTLDDLQTPPTELKIAQADLAIAKAKLSVQQAESDLTDIQAAPDLTTCKLPCRLPKKPGPGQAAADPDRSRPVGRQRARSELFG